MMQQSDSDPPLASRAHAFLMGTPTGVAIRWTVALAIAATVWYFSVFSAPPSGSSTESLLAALPAVLGFGPSQWRHVLAYAGLTYALAFAIRHWQYSRWQRAALVIVVASTYGLGIELVQSLTPDRVFDTTDILANTLGATLVIPWYVIASRVLPDET